MSRMPVALTIRLSTRRGFVKQPELMKSLGSLTCSTEHCSLCVTESENGGFSVSFDCQKSMLAEEPWSVDRDPDKGSYTYRAAFDTESTPAMIESIERMLNMPDIRKM